MEPTDFTYLLPLIILACTPVLSLLVISIYRSHRLTFFVSFLSFLVFLAGTIYTWMGLQVPYHVGELLIIDSFTLFYLVLIGATGLLLLFISYPYVSDQDVVKDEYYVLLQTAVFGAAILVASDHFASFFLGLEILSVSLYAIIAYVKTRFRSVEGGLKYLILAAASSAFLLFGMALIYTDTGTLSFPEMNIGFREGGYLSTAGLAMIIVGVGFKLALVPFHTWTPDIYEGAPTPVSALIATISKGSVIALLLRFLHTTGGMDIDWLVWAFSLMAIASMLIGNILALLQNNIKRLLAYSGIAHLGYVMIAVLAGNHLTVEAVTFYLVAYFISILGAFGTLSLLSTGQGDLEKIEDLTGIFWTRPALSILFSAMFFSLVGIPLTAGFIGKYYVVWAAVSEGLWLLAVVLVVGSVIGLYYYLRVIKTMLSPVEERSAGMLPGKIPVLGTIVLSVLGILVIWLGVYPTDVIDLIRTVSIGF
jgi:NADH-quinone oxidoreductase subunit N